MKAFWAVLAIGAGLLVASMVWSFLGEAASQKSDAGIIAGAMLLLVALAGVVALVTHYLKKWKKVVPDIRINREDPPPPATPLKDDMVKSKDDRTFMALLTLALLLPGCGVKTIPPGWEGIKVNNVGVRRGTEEYPIQTGRIFFNPFTEDVYQYPISKQNYVWTASGTEGHKEDESITFNSSEGTSVNSDVGIVFNVKPGMTPQLFVTYRQEINALKDGVIRNEVRDALNREAGKAKVMEIIGPGKADLLDRVKRDLQIGPLARFIDFETISFVHAPRPDPQVQAAINNVITAMNNATAAEAKVRQSRAEAEQMVATARGDSAAVVIRATGDAEANHRLQISLSSEIIRYTLANKWNGILPYVTSGGGSPAVLFQFPKESGGGMGEK